MVAVPAAMCAPKCPVDGLRQPSKASTPTHPARESEPIMSNEQLKKALEEGLKSKTQDPTQDVELTDGDMEDVAGGLCNGYCGSFSMKAA